MFGRFKIFKLSSDESKSTSQKPPSTSTSNRGPGANRAGEVKIEPKGLYIVLWNTGMPDKYHWGLLVATDHESGILFHQTLIGFDWKYVVETKNVQYSKSLLVALKVGAVESIDDQWIAAIKTCVRETKVTGLFTCRTWAMAALFDLADGGFIGLSPEWPKIQEIEQEAKDLGIHAYYGGVKTVTRSDLTTA
ncbi:predicted protein [Uncinocarpus reesii 1704]|uniref:Uncharacterized protein n=1 Tax=Uncinocarpus reesii (strain UAMH 1704) TaxID=336963 RepID=C4JG23_UNCRE|nr:uncharacterized protein UREG_01103 [Uncinocarpus reesii 1704]EEP76254.1 predicted protein [Uncinocarpus reesii 1704]